MSGIKIITVYEKVKDSMDDNDCNDFIDDLQVFLENSKKWKDIVTVNPD